MEAVSIEEEIEKFCGSCKQLVPIDNFHKDRGNRDGLKYICKDCSHIAESKRYHKYKKIAEEKGVCRNYGCSGIPNEGSRICVTHFYQKISSNTLKSVTYWQDLRAIAERQNYICPLTGDTLVAGVNMSLDHIKPSSKYPELKKDLKNLQWLTKWANWAKGDLNTKEFISNCLKVTNRLN
ncbi:MAG: hypothetical protein ABGY11_02515 [Candidatus Thioglobus sp.]|jgi:5-methylcytosine-specific restriction endonuclease McrA